MNYFAELFGWSAMLVGFYSLTSKDDEKLTFLQIIVNLLFIPHFILLGSVSSAVVVGFIALRIFSAYKYKNNYTYTFFMLAGIMQFAYALYGQVAWFEYLPIISSMLVTHTYFKLKQIPMRVLFIVGGILWVIAGTMLNSSSIVVANGLGIVIHFITIYRIYKDSKDSKEMALQN